MQLNPSLAGFLPPRRTIVAEDGGKTRFLYQTPISALAMVSEFVEIFINANDILDFAESF
jgi:hypothetical protein